MNDNAFDTLFEGFNDHDDDIMSDNVIDTLFDDIGEFGFDYTDNADNTFSTVA